MWNILFSNSSMVFQQLHTIEHLSYSLYSKNEMFCIGHFFARIFKIGYFCAEIISIGCSGIFIVGNFCAEIFSVGIFTFTRELLAFQRLQYPQNVGHFCAEIFSDGHVCAEIFSDGHFCAEIFSDGHFCAGIFNVEIFSFPREILAFQWLQYPPYRWTFLRCKPFPLSPASSHNKQTITAQDKQKNQA